MFNGFEPSKSILRHENAGQKYNKAHYDYKTTCGSSPDEVDTFNLHNPSSRTMTLGSTQPLTEMSTRNLPEGKGRPAPKADNLSAICESTV
jgi:hypothetical protein